MCPPPSQASASLARVTRARASPARASPARASHRPHRRLALAAPPLQARELPRSPCRRNLQRSPGRLSWRRHLVSQPRRRLRQSSLQSIASKEHTLPSAAEASPPHVPLSLPPRPLRRRRATPRWRGCRPSRRCRTSAWVALDRVGRCRQRRSRARRLRPWLCRAPARRPRRGERARCQQAKQGAFALCCFILLFYV